MSRSQKSSQRNSRAESSSSSTNQPRKQVKQCCRNFVTFMCTQVGVGALIVIYALCGAAAFMSIETQYQDKTLNETSFLRENYSEQLWLITEELNTFDPELWQNNTNDVLWNFTNDIKSLCKKGYTGREPVHMWTFPASLMYSLSVITMIGYGNMVPRTPWGKGLTVIYATFGIPLYILYFLNMGRVLARSFKFLYRSLHRCTQDSDTDSRFDALENGSFGAARSHKKVIVPSTACLWVIIFYIFTGTVMFANWEQWSYLNSFYFCMTSLCKIGFGDFVPGASFVTTTDIEIARQRVKEDPTADPDQVTKLEQLNAEQNPKLAIAFFYMLIGMGLVAMCYNLMREEVRVKLKEMKEDTKLCLDDTRSRFASCCGQRDFDDDSYY